MVDKARAALVSTRPSAEEAEEELQSIISAVEFERTSQDTSSGYAALWKDKSVRKRLLLALGMNAGQQLTGQVRILPAPQQFWKQKTFSFAYPISLTTSY